MRVVKRKKRPPKQRRSYVAPRLVKVEVRLDEAVLLSCKAASIGGPNGACAAGSTPCASDGS